MGKHESDFAEIIDHLDLAAYVAIHSKSVYAVEDLIAWLRRAWTEREVENSQA